MTIVFILATIVVMVGLVFAFSSNQSAVEAHAIINRPAANVFSYIRQLRNHEKFNVWVMMDPDMKREYRGEDGTVGFVYHWSSDKKRNVGTGEQEIKEIIENQKIVFELRFIKPFQSVASAVMTIEAAGPKETVVNWSFSSTMKMPMKLMKPMIENMLEISKK